MMNQIFDYKGTELMSQVFHPGEFLLEEIEERELKKQDVASALDILPHHLSAIFKGKRNISPKLAIKLERFLGVSAEYWINLQTSFDLQEARKELVEA